MKAQEIYFERFVSQGETTFVIPVYQRNYDWKKSNCKRLFSDILAIAKDTTQTHFIGTVCHKMSDRRTSVIIDGQQRITTLMLLLKAIVDISDDKYLCDNITYKFLSNKHNLSGAKMRLKPIKKDREVFNKVLQLDVKQVSFDAIEKESNVYTNYLLFKELLVDALKNNYSLAEITDAIERLKLVELELDSENPQVIFESLNSTGLDLTNTDLLRNYLLMSLDYEAQEELYEKYWMGIETMIGQVEMENFIAYYLILKHKHHKVTIDNKKTTITKKNLYHSFKKQFPNINRTKKQEVEDCLSEMYRYAKYYNTILSTEEPTTPITYKLYELTTYLEEKNAAIVLMYLFDKYNNGCFDDVIFDNILKHCISFVFRSMVCRNNGFNAQFTAALVSKLNNISDYKNFDETFLRILASGSGKQSFPKDKEFVGALCSTNIYNLLRSRKTKYLLWKIEGQQNPNEVLPFSMGTVEHIMPQTLSNQWIDYLNSKRDYMNYELFVNTLGNLTLTGYNGQLSNDFFVDKKVLYKKSNYAITRKISSYDDWTSKQIQSRAEQLAQIALKIWQLPSKYNKDVTVASGITYNLDFDFNIFTGTTPQKLCFLGEERDVPTWKYLVIYCIKEIYRLNADIFDELLAPGMFHMKKKVLSTTNDGMIAYVQISDSLFLDTNNSTAVNLAILKTIVDYYSEEEGYNLSDEIWFTLKPND